MAEPPQFDAEALARAITFETSHDMRHEATLVTARIPGAALRDLLSERALVRHMTECILRGVCERAVETILESPSMQARISALRAELPTRIEEAVSKAITDHLIARLDTPPTIP